MTSDIKPKGVAKTTYPPDYEKGKPTNDLYEYWRQQLSLIQDQRKYSKN